MAANDEGVPIPRYLALLWGHEDPTPRRGPKPTLTVRDIGRTAAAIADRSGWEAVTMKAIADELGMTTMSLYRYVDSKEDVLEILAEEAYGRADPALTASGSWRDRITAWARAAVDGFRTHPWLATLPLSRPPMGPNVLSWTNTGLQAFDETALSGQQKLNALLVVDGFVRQHVRQSTQLGMFPTPTATAAEPAYEALVGAVIDAESMPSLAAAVRSAMAEATPDDDFFAEQFDFGLSIVLDGLGILIDGS
ncbi:TetR/AcrR family transcriptional regulator [Gordonia sp. NPDC003425]